VVKLRRRAKGYDSLQGFCLCLAGARAEQAVGKTFEVRRSQALDGRGTPMTPALFNRLFLQLVSGAWVHRGVRAYVGGEGKGICCAAWCCSWKVG
jgi:hypothetical protein